VSVAASNDDRFLHLTLTTHDRGLYSLMFRRGLILWIDPDGGRHRTLGIRYPLGVEDGPGRDFSRTGPARVERDGATVPSRDPKPDDLVPPAQILEILRSDGEEPQRVLASDLPGFGLEIVDGGDTFTYRLKIPLASVDDRSIGVGVRAGETVGVGWETEKPTTEGPSTEGRGSHGGMGGGFGGGRRGGGSRGGMGGAMSGETDGDSGGGGGRRRGGDDGSPPDGQGGRGSGREDHWRIAAPLKVWVKIQLAAAGAPESR
jgi:hypothetical protein